MVRIAMGHDDGDPRELSVILTAEALAHFGASDGPVVLTETRPEGCLPARIDRASRIESRHEHIAVRV